MTHLLDTAPWINAVLVPHVLPEKVRRLLATEEEKGLCSVSLLEAAILHRIGRLELSAPLREFFTRALAADVRVLELTPAIAARTNDLGAGFQGDPFDRTIAATATELGLRLVTCDPMIRDAGVCAVEYYPFRPLRARRQ